VAGPEEEIKVVETPPEELKNKRRRKRKETRAVALKKSEV
jgi:hypothetical protein